MMRGLDVAMYVVMDLDAEHGVLRSLELGVTDRPTEK